MMKSRKPSFTFKSFRDLKVLLENKSFPSPHFRNAHAKRNGDEQNSELEEKLFSKAMEGVIPIPKDHYVERIFQIKLPGDSNNKDDAETLTKLTNLIKYGTDFNVSDTPEYIEGTGYHVHPEKIGRAHV